jgi:hypothetical protein
MRKLVFLAALFLFAGVAANAQMDVAFGATTITGSTASASSTGSFTTQNIGGGFYPAFSADYLFYKGFGIGGNIAWRGSQNLWQGVLPYRPIFWDFNGVYAPKLGTHAAIELQGGIGAESVRFYTGNVNCGSFSGCTNYQSSSHLMGHLGGGIRLYPTSGGFFIRPEGHVYFVRNNVEFSGPRVTRYGLSLGYTFGER